MKNLLFIGGGGFIGSNIIKHIDKTRYAIHVIEPKEAFPGRLRGVQVTAHIVSLSQTDEIEEIIEKHNIHTVVHLVSTLIPGSDYDDYKREFKNVIFPSIELMEYCANQHIKFVYFSSGGTVYGNRNDMNSFVEEDYMAPVSYYGWSKQMMENSILFKHRTAGLEYLIVRPSNPYGHGQNIHAKQGLVAVAIGKILSGEPMEVWGDGSSIRDYIYIDDLVEIFCQLLYENVSNETLNLGCGRGYSVNDVLAFLRIVTGIDYKIEYKNARSADVSNMVLDITKLSKFATVKFTPLMEGIRLFYNEELRKAGGDIKHSVV